MGITYTKKKGRIYRYYQCLSASKNGYDTCPVKSVPAGEIEAAVVSQLREALRSPEILAKANIAASEEENPPYPQEFASTLQNVDAVWEHLFPLEQARICKLLVEKAAVSADGLEVHLRDCGIKTLYNELKENSDHE